MSSTRDTLTQSARPTLKRKRGRPIKVEDPKDWTPTGNIVDRPRHRHGTWARNGSAEKDYLYKVQPKIARREPSIEKDIEYMSTQLNKIDLNTTGVFNPSTSLEKKYSVDQKVIAVTAYFVSGCYENAAVTSGIAYPHVLAFKNRPWWTKVMNEIRRTKAEELDLKLTAAIHYSVDKIVSKMKDPSDGGGDEVVLRDGKKVRKEVDMHRLATTLSILFDKRALGRGEATSRTEKVDPKKKLDDLAKQFKDITGGESETSGPNSTKEENN